MQLKFEHDYQKKVMTQTFAEVTTLSTKADVLKWRSLWLQELKSWHSPYSLLIDCKQLRVQGTPEVRSELAVMMRFFKGFFLKKAVGFGISADSGSEHLPFEVFADESEAGAKVGLARRKQNKEELDFRDLIQLENHFQQHVVELTFAQQVHITETSQVQILKSKLTNNLMQWHSKWSLIVDCSNLQIDPGLEEEFKRLERYLRGFFLKSWVGYGAHAAKRWFPFDVYRARHRAAAVLDHEGSFSGNDADCRSRKSP